MSKTYYIDNSDFIGSVDNSNNLVGSTDNGEIIGYIIDEYIKNDYDIENMYRSIIKNIILKKISDEKLEKIICDYLDNNKIKTYSPIILLYNFLFSLFEYVLEMKYIALGKKAKFFVSIIKLFFISHKIVSSSSNILDHKYIYEQFESFVINNIIKEKNDELFFYMLIESDVLDKSTEPDYEDNEYPYMYAFEYFASTYENEVKIHDLKKSLKLYDIIKSKNKAKEGNKCEKCHKKYEEDCYYCYCYKYSENEYVDNKKMFDDLDKTNN